MKFHQNGQARRAMRAAPQLSQDFDIHNDADVSRWLDANCSLTIGQSDHQILGPNSAFGLALRTMQDILGIPDPRDIAKQEVVRDIAHQLNASFSANTSLAAEAQAYKNQLAVAQSEIARLKGGGEAAASGNPASLASVPAGEVK